MREWSSLELTEKLDVMRQMWISQSALGMFNLGVLLENRLASPDDVSDFAETIFRTFESFEVGDAADIARFKAQLNQLVAHIRSEFEGG